MTYQAAVQIAQTWGLLGLCALFAAAVAYALWPSNAKTFQHAAQAPLQEDAQ